MKSKPYQGIASFLKSPVGDLTKPINFIGIPFDCSTSYRPGARMAPNAIRVASMMLTDGGHPIYWIDPSQHITDLGDVETGMDFNSSMEIIEAKTGKIKDRFNLICGGDHSITLGVLRALGSYHNDLFVLHFDAHSDVWPDNFGEQYGHGTWARNIIEENVIPATNLMSVGLRSPTDMETAVWLREKGGFDVAARQAIRWGPDRLAEKIIELVGSRPLYISFDIDALDPSFAPATGTPEIAGLSPHFVLDVFDSLKNLIRDQCIGMDVVEVLPMLDHTQITALTAATLLWHIAAIKLHGFR